MRVLTVFTVLFLATAGYAQPDNGSPKSYGFLVGVSGYKKTELRPLPFTPDDVEGFKKALTTTGIPEDHIKVLHDRQPNPRFFPDKKRILKELDLTLDGLRPQDALIVALSGHGVQFKGDKTGFFCPLDAELGDKSTLIPMEGPGGLFEILKACKAQTKLLIVNACRNDPFSDLAQAARKADFDDSYKEEVPEGIAAIYSCREGQKSYYDPDRKRGIFFDHVIRAWTGEYDQQRERTIESFFDQVATKTKLDVDRTLGEKQHPVVMRQYTGKWSITSSAPRPVVPVSAKGRTFELRIDEAQPGKRDHLVGRYREMLPRLYAKHGATHASMWVPIDDSDQRVFLMLAFDDGKTSADREKAIQRDPIWSQFEEVAAISSLIAKTQKLPMTPIETKPPTPLFSDKGSGFGAPAPEGHTYFELRIYEARAGLGGDLAARFRDYSCRLFQKHTMGVVGTWSVLGNDGKPSDTLVSLVSNRSREAQDAAWRALREDTEWTAAVKASDDKAGAAIVTKLSTATLKRVPMSFRP